MKLRIGHGYDVHAFGPGDFVTLGGIRVPHDQGIVAHSDGDVVIHALCDALLGAAGMGDIGNLFPDTDARNANANSCDFLDEVIRRVHAAGLRLCNADVSIIAQSPKLAKHIAAMRALLARHMQIGEAMINIKATTHEGLGALGRAEGIAAHAVVLLEPVV